MRYPATETADKHQRILDEATRLFRARGFAGVSVGEIMRATGLTHGPFYNHFASKDALMAESVAHASGESLARLDAAGETPEGMKAYVRAYLSTRHRDSPEQGCLMAALGTEIGREPGVRTSFAAHVGALIDRVQASFPWRSKKTARRDAIHAVASMVGAVVLARAVGESALSDEILLHVQQAILKEPA